MNLANNLSLLRILLVPGFITALLYYSPERSYLKYLALTVFLLACATDALDGWIARKLGEVTQLGSYIDPIADKLLLLSGFVSLTFMTNLPPAMGIPAWVTIPIITRDALILIGSTIIFITTGALKAEPLFIGKATTVLQMVTLFAALAEVDFRAQTALHAVTFFFTVLSGARYVRMGGRMVQV